MFILSFNKKDPKGVQKDPKGVKKDSVFVEEIGAPYLSTNFPSWLTPKGTRPFLQAIPKSLTSAGRGYDFILIGSLDLTGIRAKCS